MSRSPVAQTDRGMEKRLARIAIPLIVVPWLAILYAFEVLAACWAGCTCTLLRSSPARALVRPAVLSSP